MKRNRIIADINKLINSSFVDIVVEWTFLSCYPRGYLVHTEEGTNNLIKHKTKRITYSHSLPKEGQGYLAAHVAPVAARKQWEESTASANEIAPSAQFQR